MKKLFFYDSGDEKPSVGSLEEGKSNFVLGAVLRKNSTVSNKWSLWITKKQDYETPLMQTYRFPIIIGQSEYTIALNIMNIDDNPPSIQANERNCSIEVRVSGLPASSGTGKKNQ